MDESALHAKHERMAQNLRITFQLFSYGVAKMRQNFRAWHPDESDEEIDERVQSWLQDRPPDGEGRVVSWPDRKPLSE